MGMLTNFSEELKECFWHHRRKLTIFIVLYLLLGGILGCKVMAKNEQRKQVESGQAKEMKADSIISKVQADSLIALYNDIGKRMKDAEEVVKNYQGDSNLVIQKADEMVGLWLVVSTTFVVVVIGLSVWNTYKQDATLRQDIEKVRKDLESTTHINKIGSIMTCLNCLPDPLLSDSEADRKKYVRKNIAMMYDEFGDYVRLLSEKARDSKDLDYTQLVLSVLKIAVLRSQGVFSDVSSNLAFYTFATALDVDIKALQNGQVSSHELDDRLKKMQKEFETFKGGLMMC